MRIHIPFPASLLKDGAASSPVDPPIVKIGGDLVLLELQGELDCEGDRSGQVIGVLGLERLDKPTLYLGAHHLLHGKIVNLPRPLALIQPAARAMRSDDEANGSEEDMSDDGEDDYAVAGPSSHHTPSRPTHLAPPSSPLGPEPTPSRPTASTSALPTHLQVPALSPIGHLSSIFSSSPVGPPSQARDYSSDLSSPVRESMTSMFKGKRKRTDHAGGTKKKRSENEKAPRTKRYEVVGVIRKKVVFALRPEPIVHATILPD